MDSGIAFIVVLLISVGIASAAAAIANKKGRSGAGWFLLCFLLLGVIGLIIVALLPRVTVAEPPTPIDLKPKPTYDTAKWAEFVAADSELAASVERLKPYGEQYVSELATAVLANGKGDLTGLTARIEEKAKADANVANDEARLAQLGRNITTLYASPHGVVAVLKDWRAMVADGGEYKLFGSVADFRELHYDQSFWPEVTEPAEKNAFIAKAREALEAVNAAMPG